MEAAIFAKLALQILGIVGLMEGTTLIVIQLIDYMHPVLFRGDFD